MPPVDSRTPGLARRSKKTATSLTGAGVAAATTGIFTLTAGFLDDLQPGDVVNISAITGGGTFLEGDYYLLKDPAVVGSGAGWLTGATTCLVAATEGGAPVAPSVAITAGTITKGSLDAGLGLQGDYGPSPLSPRGRFTP
jgi:hypothetical protein